MISFGIWSFQLISAIVYNQENTNILVSELKNIFDFESSSNNPDKCRFKVTVAWKQRFFCQVVPIFVKYYNIVIKGIFIFLNLI